MRLFIFLFLNLTLSAAELKFLVGSTGPGAQGIYEASIETSTGKLSNPVLIAESKNAGYVALSADQKIVYSTIELADGSAGLAAFKLNNHGVAQKLNEQAIQGKNSTHLTLDREGKNVFVANYTSGNIAVLPIGENGLLQPPSDNFQHQGSGPNPKRQTSPHAHGVYLDAANKFLYVPDLGTDKIFIYQWDGKNKKLTKNNPEFATLKPGEGPRHFVFHPQKPWAYVCNELTLTVTAFQVDSLSGALTSVQSVSTLPSGAEINGASAAEIFCSPNGKNLYVSNRIHDSVAVYSINEDGTLKLIQHQLGVPATPRAFGISPDGRWLVCAGQKSGTLNAYKINPESGLLTDTQQSVKATSASCVVFIQ